MAIHDTKEVMFFMSYSITGLIAICLSLIHLYNTVSDLCTDDRKSLDHRVNKPTPTTRYKLVSFLTLISVVLFSCTVLSGFAQNTHTTVKECKTAVLVVFGSYIPAKAAMYIVFMYRLHMCYSDSSYGYPRRFIYFMIALNAVLGVVLTIMVLYVVGYQGAYEPQADDDAFPNPCFNDEGYDATGFVILAGLFFLWDVAMNILSLTLFINPLRKAYHAMKVHHGKETVNHMTKKMIYIGVKYTILTAVAGLSTLVFLGLTWVGPVGGVLYPFDYVINCVSLMLMTAYYPDDRYFEKLCRLCILCCPREYRMYKSRASKGEERRDADPQTKDTAEAHKYVIPDEIAPPRASTTAMTAIQPSGQTDVIYEVTPDPAANPP